MKIFGDLEGQELFLPHVGVATQHGGWRFLCRTLPSEYETVEENPKPTAAPWVWRHDRAKVTCEGCLAVLDGEVVTKVPVNL